MFKYGKEELGALTTAFDGLCLSGSLPSIHVNTDVSNFTLRQINLCVCVCVSKRVLNLLEAGVVKLI